MSISSHTARPSRRGFISQLLLANESIVPAAGERTLVCIFLRGAADTCGREGEPAGPGLGERDEIVHRFDAERWRDHQHRRTGDGHADAGKIPDGVERKPGVNRRRCRMR